jgi:hypothetical protein
MAPGTVKEASSTAVSQPTRTAGRTARRAMTGRSQLALSAQIAQFCVGRRRSHHAATNCRDNGGSGALSLAVNVGSAVADTERRQGCSAGGGAWASGGAAR